MAIADYLIKLFTGTNRLPSPQGTQIGGRVAYPNKAGYTANVLHGFQKNPVVAACVGLYASTLNEPPLGILRSDGSIDTTHPLSLLFRRPNRHMGQSDFWQIVWTYLGISGNCYIKKVRSELGNIVELIPYSDAYVVPLLDQLGWVYAYEYRSNDYKQTWLAEDVIHLHNPAYRDPMRMHMGISPIEIAWDKIHTYNELQATMYSLVASNAVPSGILSAPGDIPVATVASLKDQLRKRKNAQGRERTDPLVLGSGMTYTQMGLDATKLQANEMLQELEVAICGAFRIHPVVALTSAGLARSTYNNIQSAYSEYTTLTRVPFWNALEEQLEAGLFKEYPSIQLQFDLNEVQSLQPDADALIYPVISTFEKNIITQNETRKKLGYEPLEDGDVYYYQIVPTSGLALSDEAIGDIKAPYDELDFTPPDGVREEAQKGLDWRSEYGRGGTEIGIARARDLSNGRQISPDTARRMKAYFDRHEIDKQGQGWSPDQQGFPSNGRIAWALWGGDAGQVWSAKLVRQMNAIDEQKINNVTIASDVRSKAHKAWADARDIWQQYAEESLPNIEQFIIDAGKQATSSIKSRSKAETPSLEFEQLIRKFTNANAKQQKKLLDQIMTLTIRETGTSFDDIQTDLDAIAAKQTAQMTSMMKDSGKTLQRNLATLITNNRELGSQDLAALITQQFKKISESRAGAIARTMGAAQTSVIQNSVTESLNKRIPEKKNRFVNVWLSSRDNDVRASHRTLDGKWAEIGETFEQYVPGVGAGPGLGTDPAEFMECRCILTQVRRSELGV